MTKTYTKTKISVIVPIYNVEKYLDECMESIVNQTYTNLEIIMVDDGSPDSCPQKCDEWAKKDSRIHVIHKQNAGLGFARNSGLEVATGDYVVFVDSDDYIDVKMIETMYSKLIETGAETIYCGINRVKSTGEVMPIKPVYDEAVFEGEDIIDKILLRMLGNKPELDSDHYMYMSVCLVLFSMSIIRENHLSFLSERVFLSEDMAFQIDYLTKVKSVTYIPDQLYYYRINYGSLTTKYDPRRFEKTKKLYYQLDEKLGKVIEKDCYTTILQGWFLSLSRGQIVSAVKRNGPDMIKNIKKISEDKLVREVITSYPYHKNPFGRRVFNFLLDKRWNKIMCIVIKAKVGRS